MPRSIPNLDAASACRRWLACLLLGISHAAVCAAAADRPLGPGAGPWRQVADPGAFGWDPAALAAVRQDAEANGSAAVMVVDHGRVVVAWGDLERRFKVASLRKSLVVSMVGLEVAAGRLRLDQTLGELAVDDLGGLSERERGARVVDLLAARSGVYHPAAKEPPAMQQQRPARDSHPPGTHWFYNNWDFNTAGRLFERAAGESLATLFDQRLARPLGMEDWRLTDWWDELEPDTSRYAAWEVRLSTRDLARFCELILAGGRWDDRQVVDADWIARITGLVTDFGDGSGYGLMWWVNPGRSDFRPAAPVGPILTEPHVAAQGNGGNACIVFPRLALTIVHRGDSDNGYAGDDGFLVADRILAARRDDRQRPPVVETIALTATPLAGARPAPVERVAIAVPAAEIERLAGRYALPEGGELRLVAHQGRLFGSIPGRPQVELLAETPIRWFSRSAPVVLEVQPMVEPTKPPATIVIALRGKTLRAVRITD